MPTSRYWNLFFFILTFLASPICNPAFAADSLPEVDREIVRLAPAYFPQLPKNIRRALEKRGCSIPQRCTKGGECSDDAPNVIQGSFAKAGQKDWAVLCSKNNFSSILFFWGGPTRCSAEIAMSDDAEYVQALRNIGPSRFAQIFRVILPFAGAEISEQEKISKSEIHDGIEENVPESSVRSYYCHNGKWIIVSVPHC